VSVSVCVVSVLVGRMCSRSLRLSPLARHTRSPQRRYRSLLLLLLLPLLLLPLPLLPLPLLLLLLPLLLLLLLLLQGTSSTTRHARSSHSSVRRILLQFSSACNLSIASLSCLFCFAAAELPN
jgi:hypothetical protein